MRLIPLRHAADVRTSSVDKHAHDGEIPVRLCNYTDVYRNDRVAPSPDCMMATATSEEIERFRLLRGDTVLTKDSEDPSDIGVAAYVEDSAPDFVCGYHLAIARPTSDVHPRYLTWALRSRPALHHLSAHATGISRYGLAISDIRGTPLSWVEIEEQRRIADFLDDRVVRIDRIIAARKSQLALVGEAQGAEIDMLVRGSRSNTRPLQALTDPTRPIQYGIVLPGPDFPGGIPIIKGGDIGSGRLTRLELNRTDPRIEQAYLRSRVRPGDFVIAIRGSVGELDDVPEALELANLTQDSARIAPYGCDPQWLRVALTSPTVQAGIARVITGATVKGINIEDLRRVSIPVPTQPDQCRIARAGSEVSRSGNGHRAALRRSIDLLAEYKQSLITAAVTGELDVTTAGSGIPG